MRRTRILLILFLCISMFSNIATLSYYYYYSDEIRNMSTDIAHVEEYFENMKDLVDLLDSSGISFLHKNEIKYFIFVDDDDIVSVKTMRSSILSINRYFRRCLITNVLINLVSIILMSLTVIVDIRYKRDQI